ncbi:MAG: replication factor C large subunit, partial [Methanomicrobium sp.]|nr:replication factor C large subunit [Methanomicrobium sp.]
CALPIFENLTAETVSTAKKDERATIFELVGAVLKGKDDRRSMEMSYELSDTPDTIEQWLEKSLVQIKDIKSRAEAYRYLSLSDQFIGRTFRRQYYTLWRYATSVMVLGTAAAADGIGVSDRIMPPSRWGRMSGAKRQKALRQSVLNKLSVSYHIPEDTLRDEYLKSVSAMAVLNPLAFAKELTLDKDELDFFIHDKARSSDVMKDIKKEEKELEKKEKKAKKESSEKKSVKIIAEIPADDDTGFSLFKKQNDDEQKENSEKKPAQTQSTLFSF